MGIYERLGRKRPAPKGAAETASSTEESVPSGRKAAERTSAIVAVPPPAPDASAPAPAAGGRKAAERKAAIVAVSPAPDTSAPTPATKPSGRKPSTVVVAPVPPPPAPTTNNTGITVGHKLAALKLAVGANPAPAPAPVKSMPLST